MGSHRLAFGCVCEFWNTEIQVVKNSSFIGFPVVESSFKLGIELYRRVPVSEVRCDEIRLFRLVCPKSPSIFSVFKMESRKGWDVLLKAYLTEFKPTEKVELTVHTYLYLESDQRNVQKIRQKFDRWAKEHVGKSLDELPHIQILAEETPEMEMIKLFQSANAFVLPTRGEGFCMPCLEALSMGLPTIVTNFSGPTEFMHPDWSYPLDVDRLITPEDDSWNGVRAEPSLAHLKQLMRTIFDNREEAREVGARGRKMVQARFDNKVVARSILSRINSLHRQRGHQGD
jgi:glycosyltransferase involved in cell wall biosynthesis